MTTPILVVPTTGSRNTVLQRAFELAGSGKYDTIIAIRRQLSQEGYFTAQVYGPKLSKQLRAIIVSALAANAMLDKC